MSVKVAYSRGFEKGLEQAVEKLASAYGIEKTALMDDIKGMIGMAPEEQPMFDGTDAALAGGGLAAYGAGRGAQAFGKGQGDLAANIAKTLEQGRGNLADARTYADSSRKWQQGIRDSLSNASRNLKGNTAMRDAANAFDPKLTGALGGGGGKVKTRSARRVLEHLAGQSRLPDNIDDLLRQINPMDGHSGASAAFNAEQAAKSRAAGQAQIAHAKEMQGSTRGKLNQMGFNAKNLGRAGTALKGLGALGGATLLGKKLYDVVTD